MAYVLTHFWPGGTEEEYRATIAAATASAASSPRKDGTEHSVISG
jgi:hypothetical protein